MSAAHIADITVGTRHRHDLGDIAALAASIDELGLLHPIVVTRDNVLVAGERRLAACRSLGWDEVPVTVAHNLSDAADLLKAEADENTQRKPFSPTEAEAIASAIEATLAPIREAERQAKIAAAAARQPRDDSGRVQPVPDGAKLAPSGPTTPAPKTRDIAASATGFSAESIRKVREVKALAESPETPAPVREVAVKAIAEMDATGRVDGSYRRTKEAEARETAPKPNPSITSMLESDQSLQDSSYVKSFLKALGAGTAMFTFDAERLGRLCTNDELISVEHHLKSATTFLEKMRRARSGLRLIAGGQQ